MKINEQEYTNILQAYNTANRYLAGMKHKYGVLADEETNPAIKQSLMERYKDVSEWLEMSLQEVELLIKRWDEEKEHER